MRVFERFPSVNVADAMDRRRGALLLDVREPGEFRSGHPEGRCRHPCPGPCAVVHGA